VRVWGTFQAKIHDQPSYTLRHKMTKFIGW